jgi:hypothetical protein
MKTLMIAVLIILHSTLCFAQVNNRPGSSFEYNDGSSFGSFRERDGSTTLFNEQKSGSTSFYNDSSGRLCTSSNLGGDSQITTCN